MTNFEIDTHRKRVNLDREESELIYLVISKAITTSNNHMKKMDIQYIGMDGYCSDW